MAIDAGHLFGRGISFPPRVDADGRMVWSEGEANIREAIYVILMTQFRERINLPDFGGNLGVFLFEPNTVSTHQLLETQIRKALSRWEPRIAVEAVTVVPDGNDAQAAIVTLAYRLVATRTREQLRFTLTLAN